MEEYSSLAITAVLYIAALIIPILSAIIPVCYIKFFKKEPFSNASAFSFLGKVLVVTLLIEVVLGIVLVFVTNVDIDMFIYIAVQAILLLTASFDSITKNNNDKRIFVHHIGKFVKMIIEAAFITTFAYLMRIYLFEKLPSYFIIIILAVYFCPRVLLSRTNSKKLVENRKKEKEEQGLRICPEWNFFVPNAITKCDSYI